MTNSGLYRQVALPSLPKRPILPIVPIGHFRFSSEWRLLGKDHAALIYTLSVPLNRSAGPRAAQDELVVK